MTPFGEADTGCHSCEHWTELTDGFGRCGHHDQVTRAGHLCTDWVEQPTAPPKS